MNTARSGDGGRGDNLGSTAYVELAASILNVVPGLMDRLLSALEVGTFNPTGPTPSPIGREVDGETDWGEPLPPLRKSGGEGNGDSALRDPLGLLERSVDG